MEINPKGFAAQRTKHKSSSLWILSDPKWVDRYYNHTMINKIVFLIYLSILSASSIYAQQNNQLILTIDFEPSFANSTTLTFRGVQGGMFQAEMVVFKDEEKSKVECREKGNISEDRLASILNFIKTYDFKIKGSVDTISFERVFWRGDSTTVYKISHGNDGITVSGSLLWNGVTKRFAFWSPGKETENYQLIQKIFALSNSSFKKKKSLNHLKALQNYF
jgi:hypothetical protein